MEPNDDDNNPSDNVDHTDMSPEDITTNITNGEHGKDVPIRRRDMTEIVCDVDGDKYSAGSQGYQGECCSHHAEEA